MIKRIVRTVLSNKPKEHGFIIAFGLVVICSLISVFSWSGRIPNYMLSASGLSVFQNKDYYRLFTSLFVHGDLKHLLSNSYMLFILSFFIFGTLTENFKKAIILLLALFLGGAFVNYLCLLDYEPHIYLIGISGLVYLQAGFWFTVYLFTDRRHSFKGRLIRVVGIALMILFPTSFEETTSYIAHFHGFWLGCTMGIGFFILRKDWIRDYEIVKVEQEEDPE